MAAICVVVSVAIVLVGNAAICAGVRAVMDDILAGSETISTNDFTGLGEGEIFSAGGQHARRKVNEK